MCAYGKEEDDGGGGGDQKPSILHTLRISSTRRMGREKRNTQVQSSHDSGATPNVSPEKGKNNTARWVRKVSASQATSLHLHAEVPQRAVPINVINSMLIIYSWIEMDFMIYMGKKILNKRNEISAFSRAVQARRKAARQPPFEVLGHSRATWHTPHNDERASENTNPDGAD